MRGKNTLPSYSSKRAKNEDPPYCSEIPANYKEAGCYYTHINRVHESPAHYHRHYEVALILSGKMHHYINGEVKELSAGDLLFIRPEDTHAFGDATPNGVELMNIAFSCEHFEHFRRYMDDTDFPFEMLLSSPLPTVIKVNVQEVREMYRRFDAYRLKSDNADQIKMVMRQLLCELLGCFLQKESYLSNPHPIPAWLEVTCLQMRKFENFTAPPERMVEISGRSKEHLSRTMKKYMGITPSAFVYELRILHAADLLRFSNQSVLDICFTCGFENTAYFHKKFKEKFGESPKKYRESGRKISI